MFLSVFALATSALPPAHPTHGDVEVAAQFAPPVMLIAGDKPMGRGLLYPSPALHDLDGDGEPEMILGDLFGRIYSAKKSGKNSTTWGKVDKVKGADGEDLKFSNW